MKCTLAKEGSYPHIKHTHTSYIAHAWVTGQMVCIILQMHAVGMKYK